MMKGRIAAPLQEKRTTSADGTRHRVLRDRRTARARWLMPPAMGAPLVSMKHLLERFGARLHHRDAGTSAASTAPVRRAIRGAMRVDDHLADMQAVVARREARALRARRLEHGRAALARVLRTGAPRTCARWCSSTARSSARSRSVAPGPTDALALAALRVGATAARSAQPALAADPRRARRGAVRSTAWGSSPRTPSSSRRSSRSSRKIDWARYFTMTRHLHEHSRGGYLADVRVPTLITAGTHDFMTPVSVAEAMHRAHPGLGAARRAARDALHRRRVPGAAR